MPTRLLIYIIIGLLLLYTGYIINSLTIKIIGIVIGLLLPVSIGAIILDSIIDRICFKINKWLDDENN